MSPRTTSGTRSTGRRRRPGRAVATGGRLAPGARLTGCMPATFAPIHGEESARAGAPSGLCAGSGTHEPHARRLAGGMRTTPSDQQVAAIEEPGVVFVSAGAGTGKTTVLVERFVKAVCERGLGIDNV